MPPGKTPALPPAPAAAVAAAALVRHARLCGRPFQVYRAAVRAKLTAADEELQIVRGQRDQLLGLAAEAAGSAACPLDSREQAVLAAHRLHTAACRAAGYDEHWAGRAFVRAGTTP